MLKCNENVQFDIKLRNSIKKYKESIFEIMRNRRKLIFLNNLMFVHSSSHCDTKRPYLTGNGRKCASRNKNGSHCASIVKKNSIYCHRHHKLLNIQCE